MTLTTLATRFGLLLLGGMVLAGCQQASTNEDATLTPTPFESASNANLTGEQLFDMNCASCHGAGGSGNTAIMQSYNIHMTDKTWQAMHTDDQIKATIRQGKGMMPAFETAFSVEDVDKLVVYIRSLAPAKAE